MKMSNLILELADVPESAERAVEETAAAVLKRTENHQCGSDGVNMLIHGENLSVLKQMFGSREFSGKINMIYVDPPFFTKSVMSAVTRAGKESLRYHVYNDRWEHGLFGYLKELTARLILMKELLADDGLLFLHLDWHAVHYAKIIMDEVFGAKHFVNEIIWTYKSGGSTRKRFSRKHDSILVYSKTGKYNFYPLTEKSYNRGFKPYHFKGVEEFCDENGWYTFVNMKDVWPIDMVGRTSSERTGYATQKPEQLIRRIIDCSTKEGDLCADFFCGSGTLPAVAAENGRRFIACDNVRPAVEKTIRRLSEKKIGFSVYEALTAPEGGESEEAAPEKATLKEEVQEPAENPLDAVISAGKTIGSTGDAEVRVAIEDVTVNLSEVSLERRSAEKAEALLTKDPFLFIDSWSADLDYDGDAFCPDFIIVNKDGTIDRVVTKNAPADAACARVKIVDVMGRVMYKNSYYK